MTLLLVIFIEKRMNLYFRILRLVIGSEKLILTKEKKGNTPYWVEKESKCKLYIRSLERNYNHWRKWSWVKILDEAILVSLCVNVLWKAWINFSRYIGRKRTGWTILTLNIFRVTISLFWLRLFVKFNDSHLDN